MDEAEFFRQATLRICGNLEIHHAMVELLRYLRPTIPVDKLFVEYYDQGLSAVRTIAEADVEAGRGADTLAPLDGRARAIMKRWLQDGAPGPYVYTDPENQSPARELLTFHRQRARSLMVLPVGPADAMLGNAVLISQGEPFTEHHAELMCLLREPFAVALSNALRHAEVNHLKELLADENRYLRGELARDGGETIVGADFGLKSVMDQAMRVARLDSPVLLLGETGVGKDVIANAIHAASSRREGPFISVNCGAIPESLLDSELFGHERGAFTGALSRQRGRFERADGGTIFLDEVGELPPQAQVKLLRVLQDRTIERVGGSETITLDIRVLAATNRNLEGMVTSGEFRSDLWFRLSVFPIHVPPLRERMIDLPALVRHFLVLKAKELKLSSVPAVTEAAMDRLAQYGWPGNIRELANVIERALILAWNRPVEPAHLGIVTGPSLHEGGGACDRLDTVTVRHIREVLARTGGQVDGKEGAAAILGLKPSTLRSRMDKLRIPYGRNS